MKKNKTTRFIFVGFILAGLILLWVMPNGAREISSRHGVPQGVFINLTKDFYRELEKPEAGERVYGTRQADEYLRQIAVSAKFTVETNLHIIHQHEKIIELLEAIKKKQ